MQIAPAGDRALLVTLGDVTAAQLHARTAAVRAMPGVIACVPGHSSLLVVFDGVPDPSVASAVAPVTLSSKRHVIPVHFNGVDLAEFFERVPRDEFFSRVESLRLTVRYLGFRGGFAYLDGWPREWAMRRRPTSRPVVRGSFAIAGEVAGFYPIDSPGGWNILGITGEVVEHRFEAGDRVSLRVSEMPSLREVKGNPAATRHLGHSATLLSGPLVTVVTPTDWSRVERGISEGGPFDDVAAAVVSGAVTNPVVLECPMVAPRIRYERPTTVAWFDGELRVERVEGEHSFGRVKNGLRGYLAIGDGEGTRSVVERGDRHVVRAVAGPHDIAIREIECDVTPQLDRVGIRMIPRERIEVAIPSDLKSCGMLCGTMQLHPDGSVVVMGPDHPVTGGYLMPMTVISSERWKLAQLVPGERVRFVAVQPPY